MPPNEFIKGLTVGGRSVTEPHALTGRLPGIAALDNPKEHPMSDSQQSLNHAHLAIIGLGYVGLPLAVEFGRKYPTLGFDINKDRIEALKGDSIRLWKSQRKNLVRQSN